MKLQDTGLEILGILKSTGKTGMRQVTCKYWVAHGEPAIYLKGGSVLRLAWHVKP